MCPARSLPRVAFILSHPFQQRFYAGIPGFYDRPVFVLEHRADTPFSFPPDFVAGLDGQVIRLAKTELGCLDGLVDVIFAMTPKHLAPVFRISHTVALQYSLAKEPYQYRAWRMIADLNLTRGPYSQDRLQGFCHAAMTGNPRYDGLSRPKPRRRRGDQSVTLLYLPSYGELSTLALFLRALPDLPTGMTLQVKLHHASEFADSALVAALRAEERIDVIDGYADALPLMATADLLLSDYSGAIFDALYLGRPVALIQPPLTQTKVRTGPGCLGIARADDIGPVACTAAEIPDVIAAALAEPDLFISTQN